MLILLGCIGGLLPDILRLIKNKYEIGAPPEWQSLRFWISLLLQVAIGGLASWVLQATTAKDALAFGFAAPELLSKLISTNEGRAQLRIQKDEHLFTQLRKWWQN